MARPEGVVVAGVAVGLGRVGVRPCWFARPVFGAFRKPSFTITPGSGVESSNKVEDDLSGSSPRRGND